MATPANLQIIEDAINKMIDSLSEYEKALLYMQLNRQGMTVNHAEIVLRKGP